MDIEEHFLSCLLRGKNWRAVTDARISPEFFEDDQHRRVFEFIQKHVTTYGQLPLASMVRSNWPTYRLIAIDHSIDYYVTELRKKYLHSEMKLVIADVAEELDENRDPQAALRVMQNALGDLATIDSVMVDVDLAETWEDRLTDYEEFRENKGQLRGISTGFPSLDKATLGLQPKQFIVVIGLPKAGKSTLLLVLGINAHNLGKRVLFIGFEMSNQEQGARYDSVTARVDHLKLLSGSIGTKDIRDLERVGQYRAENLEKFIASTDISSATTVSGIRAKIQQHEPDLVLVDGLYLMDDEYGEPKGSPAALTNISRALKRLAQTEEVPIVGTTQALHSKVSRAMGLTASSAGYTSAWAQDTDLMLGVEAVEDDPTVQRVKALANRIGPKVEFAVEWDWSVGTFDETESEDDVEGAA